jgi:hypothetical protein
MEKDVVKRKPNTPQADNSVGIPDWSTNARKKIDRMMYPTIWEGGRTKFPSPKDAEAAGKESGHHLGRLMRVRDGRNINMEKPTPEQVAKGIENEKWRLGFICGRPLPVVAKFFRGLSKALDWEARFGGPRSGWEIVQWVYHTFFQQMEKVQQASTIKEVCMIIIENLPPHIQKKLHRETACSMDRQLGRLTKTLQRIGFNATQLRELRAHSK